MTQVMLDLETMGNCKTAAIIAIGAVGFNSKGLIEHSEFYQEVNLQSSIDAGLTVDGSTVMWWLKQSAEARKAFENNDYAKPLTEVLDNFTSWCNEWKVKQVWGCGASFDNAILDSAYRLIGKNIPWAFWDDCCYRTVKSMYPKIKLDRTGLVHHHALGDAKAQALHLIEMGVL